MRPNTEAARTLLDAAVRELQLAIREEYPVGSRVMIRRGYDKHLELEVVSHPPLDGYQNTNYMYDLYCRNPKTGKRREIHVHDVLEDE